jgi:hypothetical protein
MSKPAKPTAKYILFGADEYAKPRAARFSAENPALLAKAPRRCSCDWSRSPTRRWPRLQPPCRQAACMPTAKDWCLTSKQRARWRELLSRGVNWFTLFLSNPLQGEKTATEETARAIDTQNFRCRCNFATWRNLRECPGGQFQPTPLQKRLTSGCMLHVWPRVRPAPCRFVLQGTWLRESGQFRNRARKTNGDGGGRRKLQCRFLCGVQEDRLFYVSGAARPGHRLASTNR